MPLKDPYEMFPVYIQLREALLTTSNGRDLLAVLYKRKMPEGYELRRTDRFYIDLGSPTYLRKLPDGRWYYTALSDGRPFSETYYSTMEEMITDVWVKAIIKRAPKDVKKSDIKNWLISPDCPAKGKELSIDDIISLYMETNGDAFFIRRSDTLFDSPEWKEIFSFLGLKPRIINDGNFRPTYSFGNFIPLNNEMPHFKFWASFIMGVADNPEEAITSWQRTHLGASLKTTPKIGKVSRRYFNSTIEIIAGVKTKEELEKVAISELIDSLKKSSFIIGKDFNENPILQLIVSLLSKSTDPKSNWISQIAEFVLKNPTTLEHIPKEYKSQIMEAAGISEELEETIRYAKEMGILK